ncbi:B- and T-lymphocyte attenuator-like isoform X1 [Centroberyx affinis]|uniref:B- and T-lymphocyte attenuator-like isoform X1 n=1 Tax=Centroberyx affinis TaxID=166261 RepID=UPI003A5C465C
MDRTSSDFHLLLCFLALLCIHGKGQVVTGLSPSCEVGVTVQRGIVWKAVPQQHLTINCTVKHCGETLYVTWCKLLDTNICEQINNKESVVRQTDKYVKDELISFLDFKRISISDDGLYRCQLREFNYALVSHSINVSISDRHKPRVENFNSNANDSSNITSEEAASLHWVPYLTISISVVVLVFIVTVISLLSFYNCKRLMTNSQTKGQEMSTLMLPDIPKDSTPSAAVLHAHYSNLYDNYLHSNAVMSRSPMTHGAQPVANSAGGGQGSSCLVYATLNHLPSGTSGRTQQTTNQQDEHSDYAAIRFS